MTKLSASSIKTYEKCPRQYFYNYIEKPEIAQKDWTHLELGKFAHRCLELFHIHLMSNSEEPDAYAKIMSDSMKKAMKEWKKEGKDTILSDDLPDIQKILQAYLNSVKQYEFPNVVAVEKSFNIQLDDFNIKGFIDRLDKVSDTEYRIVDYKTNKNPKYLNKFQLLLYAYVVKKLYPETKKVSGKYILLRHESKSLDWTFDEKDYKDLEKEVIETGASIINDKVWEKKPSKLCEWCDFKTLCQDNWCD